VSDLSEVDGECAEVCDDSGTKQHVTGDVEVFLSKHPCVDRPALLLSAQTADQLLRAVKLLAADVDVLLEFFLLLRHRFELVVQRL